MAQHKEEIITVNRVSIWTTVQGQGLPVVLCHGGPGGYDNLGPVAGMVDDIARVFRYDQRGSGRSQTLPPYNVATFVEDLDGLREHWGIDRWVVGGHSWGANLALAYLLEHTDRCLGLLYISGTGVDPAWKDEYHRNREARLSDVDRGRHHDLKERIPTAKGEAKDRLIDELFEISMKLDIFDPTNAVGLPRYDEHPTNNEVNAVVEEDWSRTIRERDLEQEIASIRIPAIVVHGEEDPRPSWPAARIAELIPSGRYFPMPKVAHYPWLERPGPLGEEIRRFLLDLADREG